MKVLVTGGAGYVGSVMTRHLLEAGFSVRVLDALMHGDQGLLGLDANRRFELKSGDLRSRPDVQSALIGIDAVVHLAAIVGDPACARQPELARAINLDGSLTLIEAAKRAGVQRFVFASTCSNYGRMADGMEYVTEESALQPLSFYAETKVAVEQALLGGQRSDIHVPTVLRLATVFGLSPRMRFDLTVNEFTLELMTKRKLAIYGAQFWRPYIHVQDVARAVRTVLESGPGLVRGEAFNVGDTGQNYQKGQIVDLICAQLGDGLMVERVEKAEDPRDYRVSFEKIRRVLGFQITKTVPEGIREIIEAIRAGRVGIEDLATCRN